MKLGYGRVTVGLVAVSGGLYEGLLCWNEAVDILSTALREASWLAGRL